MENTSGTQIPAERSSADEWIKNIRMLDKRGIYNEFSAAGRARAKELDPEVHLTKFVQWLEIIAKRKEVAA
jgi:hypothetical protein